MSTTHQQYEDGAAKEKAQGTLALGIDSSTGKVRGVALDADGKLVVSGVAGATSTEYADGAARGTATGTLAMVDDGVNLQSMAGDANGQPQVVVVTQPARASADAALGQVAMAASIPVAIANNQSAVPVSATHLDTRHLNVTDDAVVVSATHLDTRHLNVTDDAVVVSATHLDVRHLNTSDDAVVVADGGNTITVDNGGTFAVQAALAAAVAAADGSAYGTGVLVQGDDGTDRRAILVGTDGHVQVDVLSTASHAVTNAGTFAAQVTAVGTVADDATTPGAPVMVGGKAVAMDGTDPTAVAEGDAAIARTTLDRRALVTLEHPYSPDPVFHEETGAVTDHELIAAPAAGFRIHIDWITISNDGTAALTVKFEEATAGAKTQRLGTIRMAAACPGVHLPYVSNPPKCTAATNFGMTTTGTTNYSVTVGYHLAP